jgi:predicted nucleotidyltransferase
MPHTSYPDVEAILNRLRSDIQETLGDNLVGLYLYGSLVTGDFDSEISDIDLLAVTASAATDTELERLREMHERFACNNPVWEDRIEAAYVSTIALKTFRTPSATIAIISPGEPFHTKEAGHDWLLNWYIVLNQGVVLIGPSPNTLIPQITKDEFLNAVRRQVADWGEWIYHLRERKAQAYAILTMCRALYAIRNGEQTSKRRAALWAMEALPEWSPLIDNALLWREAWREDAVDHAATFPETVRFVHSVRDFIVQPIS